MASAAIQLQKRLLSFWFKDFTNGEILPTSLIQFWFSGGEAVDNECRKSFGKELEEIVQKGSYVDELKQTPEGTLSLIILLDQIPRNIFRKTARPFVEFDPLAIDTAKYCISRKWDEKLEPIQRMFAYMPFEHSENIKDQEVGLKKNQWNADTAPEVYAEITKSSLDYAEKHIDIIKRFGRFPHRNEWMGRESTKEEIDFLENGKNIF